jgi:hypothetical protein
MVWPSSQLVVGYWHPWRVGQLQVPYSDSLPQQPPVTWHVRTSVS